MALIHNRNGANTDDVLKNFETHLNNIIKDFNEDFEMGKILYRKDTRDLWNILEGYSQHYAKIHQFECMYVDSYYEPMNFTPLLALRFIYKGEKYSINLKT